MVSESLPKEATAPARARQLLDEVDADLPQERLEDARLLLSEIVTNAVEHVREHGPIQVTLQAWDHALRIEVVDPGEGFVPRRERDPDNHRGWGLQFVQRLSDRWGVDSGETSRVWFELKA